LGSTPIQSIIVGRLIDPEQRRPAVQANQPLFCEILARSHMQQELMLADPKEAVSCLTFGKRLCSEKTDTFV
jgi:hypothetical protein